MLRAVLPLFIGIVLVCSLAVRSVAQDAWGEFAPQETSSVVAANACNPALVPCAPIITGSFGSKMAKEPMRPSRSWIVVCSNPSADSGCDFGSMSQALLAIQFNHKKGDSKLRTIRVKPGTYRMGSEGGDFRLGATDGVGSGTRSKPMALVAYDQKRPPEILGTCSRSECSRNSDGNRQSVVVAGDWWLIDGFEFNKLDWALFIDSEHVTVRNSTFETASKFAINISHRSEGFVHIEDNHIQGVGFDHTHHGIYASNGQGSTSLRSNGGCGELSTEKVIKDAITIRGNYFRDITGSAVQLNASHSNWQDHRSISGFNGRRLPDTGIHSTLIENNVVVDTGYGINLYRYAFGARIVNNTLISTRDGKQKSQGHFLQIRNSAFNTISNNLFYSDIGSKKTIIGSKECPKDPSNDLNVIDYNLWCVPGNAEYSWDLDGTGLYADRDFSDFKRHTGQEEHGTVGATGSGVCSSLTLNTSRFELPSSKRGGVADKGVGVLKTRGKSFVDFNGDNSRNGGDEAVDVCPADDYRGKYRQASQCDIGAHEYDGGSSPPDEPDPDPPPDSPPDPEPPPDPVDPPPAVVRAPLSLSSGNSYLVLQEGERGYEGVHEAHIREDKPNTEYGSKTKATISDDSPTGTGKEEHLLLKWDMVGSPGGWKVKKGEIWLFVSERVKGNGFQLNSIRRDWSESTVTWNSPWATKGANGSSDRGSSVLGSMPEVVPGWNKIELTSAGIEEAQRWVDSPGENFGFIISPADTAGSALIITSEHGTTIVRPILVLNVEEQEVLPVSTLPTDSPVPLPETLPRGAEVYIYQQGHHDYAGAADAHILEQDPVAALGDETMLNVSGDFPIGSGFDSNVVIRFGDLSVEAGENVCAAELWIQAEGPVVGAGFDVYALNKSWSESDVTWSNPWSKAGAQSLADRGTVVLGTAAPSEMGWHKIALNEEGLAVVQQWVDNPSTNHGLILQNSDQKDQLVAVSSDNDTVRLRPTLLIATGDGPAARSPDSDITDAQTAELIRGDESDEDATLPGSVGQSSAARNVQASGQAKDMQGALALQSQAIPDKFGMDQNYPNPFNPTTSIPYLVPSTGRVRISLFDLLGRKVVTIVDRVHQPGAYTARLDISGRNLPSGVYLFRMVGEDFQQTRRMTLQR